MLCVDDQTLGRPGVFVESRIRPHVSGVLCLTLHGGADLTRTGAQSAFVTIPMTLTFWTGFYGPNVLAKGCEPYDQPAASAHMPLPFSAFERHPFSGIGTLFIERRPRTERMRRLVVDDGHHRRFRSFPIEESALFSDEIAAFFELAGVSRDHRTKASERVLWAYRRAVVDDAFLALDQRRSSKHLRIATPAEMPKVTLPLSLSLSNKDLS